MKEEEKEKVARSGSMLRNFQHWFGFSIEECRELLSLYQDKNRPSREVKELALEKLLKIDKKLEELQNLRNQLHHLSKNCSGDDRPECPILDALAKENEV